MHIPSSSRLTVSTQRKKNGQPRRPLAGLTSTLSNLHLLLRVPSFARWPLRLHFFAPDVHSSWEKWCSTVNEPLKEGLEVLTDFGPRATREDGGPAHNGSTPAEPWGIHALPLDYAPVKEYVTKGESIFTFEREGDCVVCGDHMAPGEGLYVVCTNDTCEGVGHLACWSRHLLSTEEDPRDAILPLRGNCPKCGGAVQWGDMMKEVTLRVRGRKDVEKLLKKGRSAQS